MENAAPKPVQPTTVTVVLEDLDAAALGALLSSSSACLQDTPANRAALAALDRDGAADALPGVVSFAPAAPGQPAAKRLRAALAVLDDLHDGWYWTRWATIEIRGVERLPETAAAAADFGRVPPPEDGPFRVVNIDHED